MAARVTGALDLLAVSVSSTIGRIARWAVARPASSASAVPPSTPSSRNARTRASVWSRSDSGTAYISQTFPYAFGLAGSSFGTLTR